MGRFIVVILALFLVSLAQVKGTELPDSSTLIVGGRPAKQGETPYMLSLRYLDWHFCGGTLVEVEGLQVGITAAHCVYHADWPGYDVVAGDLNLNDTTGIEQKLPVVHIIKHELHNMETHENDIAVVFFNGTFQLNDNVKVMPLPTLGQVTSQGNLTVSGWGRLEVGAEFPDDLHIVGLPLVNDTDCQRAYQNYTEHVTDSMICAGRPAGDISPCHRDSGGPAISDAGYLAGIVSWGYECGHPGYPGVFTKVSFFVEWIHHAVTGYKNSPQS